MAAPILSFERLGLIQGEGWLFRELDIHIGTRDRLALTRSGGALTLQAKVRLVKSPAMPA